MRVCMVVYDLQEFGGLEEYALTIAVGLQNMGHQVSFLSTAWVPADNQYALRLAANRIPLVQLPRWLSLPASDWTTKMAMLDWCTRLLSPAIVGLGMARAALKGDRIPRSATSARNWVRGQLTTRLIGRDWRKPLARALLAWWRMRWHPDLLHLHGYTTNLLFVIDWAHDRGVPVVYEEHQTPDPQFDWWRGFAASVNKASMVVAVSGESAQALRELCGIVRPVVVVTRPMPDPAELGWTDGAAGQRCDGRLNVTTVGRLYVTKGLHYLLDAIAAIQARYPSVRFRVYGDGPLREELIAHAARLGLDGESIFAGPFTSRRELARIMEDTDIFVMSSVLEGQPLALVEAMAYGRPIVTTAVGGIPELIIDGVNGLLCPPRDSVVLASRICELIEDPELRARLGKAARASYEKGPFRLDAVCRKLVSVYEEALGQGRGPR